MTPPFPVVERQTLLSASAERIFAWHTRPGAFERLVPPWEDVRLTRPMPPIEERRRIFLSARVGPIRRRWVAELRDVIPGRQFVDEQIDGPFSSWVHTHRMEPRDETSAVLSDRIEYSPPFGTPGIAAGEHLVRPRLERMLRYRHDTTAQDLAAHARYPETPLRIAVTGASGLVGSALIPFLTSGGHDVTRVVRHDPGPNEIGWDPEQGVDEHSAFEGLDVVVHLAGESIAGGRWTAERKRRILYSRSRGTRHLIERLTKLEHPPRVLVCASAVGYYGDRGDDELVETSHEGRGFLAHVASEWEAATREAARAGIRVVNTRFGIVLSPRGGALAKFLPPFTAGIGGRIGDGRQWMSWISIDDVIGVIQHAIMTDGLHGAINTMAPAPVRNAEFAATLGAVLHRPAAVPVPALAIRLALGEMGEEMLLASQRATPSRLLATSYVFRHPTLELALRHVLGR